MIESYYQLNTPISLALVSDLHGRPYERVIESLRRNAPEAICVCGDFIYGRFPEDGISPLSAQTYVLPFIKACADTAKTFVSLGNHEWMLDAADLGEIEKTGAKVLDNDWTEWNGIVIGGLTSAGVDDYRRFREESYRSADKSSYLGQDKLGGADAPNLTCPRWEVPSGERYPRREITHRTYENLRPETEWIDQMPTGYKVLMSHHPEYWDYVKDKGIDLMLSGHTHNGQIAYYSVTKHRWTGLWAPGQGWFPKYSSGVYEDGKLVVSAGLSNTVAIPRLFNPTQVIYIQSHACY